MTCKGPALIAARGSFPSLSRRQNQTAVGLDNAASGPLLLSQPWVDAQRRCDSVLALGEVAPELLQLLSEDARFGHAPHEPNVPRAFSDVETNNRLASLRVHDLRHEYRGEAQAELPSRDPLEPLARHPRLLLELADRRVPAFLPRLGLASGQPPLRVTLASGFLAVEEARQLVPKATARPLHPAHDGRADMFLHQCLKMGWVAQGVAQHGRLAVPQLCHLLLDLGAVRGRLTCAQVQHADEGAATLGLRKQHLPLALHAHDRCACVVPLVVRYHPLSSSCSAGSTANPAGVLRRHGQRTCVDEGCVWEREGNVSMKYRYCSF
eukprot:Rhum_TRINITY_DN13642_c0_g1::Rhum_TRINITY_DN13642_c0_g1_i4::g.62332::m.62332